MVLIQMSVGSKYVPICSARLPWFCFLRGKRHHLSVFSIGRLPAAVLAHGNGTLGRGAHGQCQDFPVTLHKHLDPLLPEGCDARANARVLCLQEGRDDL